MSQQNNRVFPSVYLGSVQYYAHLIQSVEPIIEQFDFYNKKTNRNRCTIAAANGPMSLSVPVVHSKQDRLLTRDVRISYDEPWQKQHQRSIVSAYNSSPFLEYYWDEFAPFYQKKYDFLIDFNMGLTEVILDHLELDYVLKSSTSYADVAEEVDFRPLVNPKFPLEKDVHYKVVPYRQVFTEKYPFASNLSIIDLLFNKGPEAIDLLDASIEK
ncbi:MAG: WbqC family protein [Marinilabiliaceae bacterium]|nr:WbqC family protein [Marinilabiliaceae bacterium]